MGAGGALKQIIVDTGAGAYAGKLLASSHISLLLVAYIIAGSMRLAQGSATVSIITAAGLKAGTIRLGIAFRRLYIVGEDHRDVINVNFGHCDESAYRFVGNPRHVVDLKTHKD